MKPDDRQRPRGDRGGVQQGRTGAAAVAAAAGYVPTDEELAAAAEDGLNVWDYDATAGCVATLVRPGKFTGRSLAEAQQWVDDLLAEGVIKEIEAYQPASILAGSTLRQAMPASFHQLRPGIVTRRAAKLAEQQLQQEAGTAATGAEAGAGPSSSPAAVGAEQKGEDAAELQETDFSELRQIAPSNGHVIVVLDPKADVGLMQTLMGTGAETAVAAIRLPSTSFKELMIRGSLSALPAAMVASTPAALAAALGSSSSVSSSKGTVYIAENYVLAGVKRESIRGSGLLPSDDLLPALPYLKPGAFKLYDVRSKKSVAGIKMLLDSGSDGGLMTEPTASTHRMTCRELEGAAVSTADGGTAHTPGVLDGVKLIMLPGTVHATAVAYDALVVETQGPAVYDAILGREQMHQLGMLMDFGRQKCYIRPKLKQGVWDLVEVPWICMKRKPGGTKAAAVAGTADEASTDEDSDDECPGLASSDSYDDVLPELLPATGSALGGQPKFYVDYRGANALLKPCRDGWEGEEEAKLMASGDVEPNPGPLQGFATYPETAELFAVLMCVLACCLSGVFAVGYAAMGLFSRAAVTAAAGWMSAVVCYPLLSSWAKLKLEMAKAPRARRPKKRESWQLREALSVLPVKLVKRHKYTSRVKLGASWVLILLVALLLCSSVTAMRQQPRVQFKALCALALRGLH